MNGIANLELEFFDGFVGDRGRYDYAVHIDADMRGRRAELNGGDFAWKRIAGGDFHSHVHSLFASRNLIAQKCYLRAARLRLDYKA